MKFLEISRFFKIIRNSLWTSANFEQKYFKTNRILSVSAHDSENRKKQIIFTIRPIFSSPTINSSTIYLKSVVINLYLRINPTESNKLLAIVPVEIWL